ncbi:MAG TPA: site-specific DNA-methyltransferase [Candidatus Acidoferrum sp.]|nr:site-specific DNA-methyltransferase [Candidatus Acidoferrum sp.]
MPRNKKPGRQKILTTLRHEEATRKNIPTAELQSLAERAEELWPKKPVHYPRSNPLPKGETRPRNADLDPQLIWNGARIKLTQEQIRALEQKGEIEIGEAQLVWRGKDNQDWSDLVMQAPPLYIQEKIHPKVIIDDLLRRTKEKRNETTDAPDLFADFNGLVDPEARLEFYQHDQHWSNRMILGDSLQVMASLAERESLRGKVQCIYIDPPYGIKFNSNWQVSTLSRDVKDGKREDVSREPEQVKAFRDTWKDGIHSYLTYLRDRLGVAKELLSDSGSIFVQIGDENLHRVRALMDEVFGAENLIANITVQKAGSTFSEYLGSVADYVLWYANKRDALKYRELYRSRGISDADSGRFTQAQLADGARIPARGALPPEARLFAPDPLESAGMGRQKGEGAASWFPVELRGKTFRPTIQTRWKTNQLGMGRLQMSDRLLPQETRIRFQKFVDDFPVSTITNVWTDLAGATDKIYVVQTNTKIVERCVLMTTDPGDLVLDPTCGSGTTAYVSEQWGRRWIAIDTSRVALALARARIMGARYPYYYLADSTDGRTKEQEVTGKIQPSSPTHDDIRQGFVYERAPHVTLGSIAKNAEIDVIWEEAQKTLEPLRAQLNDALGKKWEEWEIPREADPRWSDKAKQLHKAWWEARIARQKKIDDSIAKNADVEFLYDRPYEDKTRVRVAGPFTVESLSPHRVVPADEEELLDTLNAQSGKRRRMKLVTPPTDFAEMILENLRTAGVQQSRKGDKLNFTSLVPWPGEYVNAEGRFMEGNERRAAVFIGPEFGTVSRVDLVAAAREATDARFDLLIACAFSFDAHSSELTKLGPLPILRAKMNPDLHMADDLKNTGKGNLFVVFGEPDIDIRHLDGGRIEVRVKGVDVFDPNTGEIRSNDAKDIAAWFIDTDYNEESFFVRHAYFLGAQDPYKSLKTTLKAEIDPEAWETLYRETSRPFPRPSTGRIAVKVINHFGDEVMKVFGV